MYYKFFISLNSNDPTIFNINKEILKENKLSDSEINLIIEQFGHEVLYFISKNRIQNFKKVWTDSDSDICLVDNDNISFNKNDELNDVFFFVNNEHKLAESLISVIQITTGTIDLKFKNFDEYDEEVLLNQLEIIKNFVIQLIKSDFHVPINQLTGFFNFDSKFNQFGESAFFISPEMNVYSHPSFYYKNNNEGIIDKISNFKEYDEMSTHFTKPHILCFNCECFYCDRNIFLNKLDTTEFNVPAEEQCKQTTILSNFSKKIFNSIQPHLTLNTTLDLDVVKVKIEAEAEYQKLESNSVQTNLLKKMSFNKFENKRFKGIKKWK